MVAHDWQGIVLLLESDKGWEGGDKVPEDRKAQGGMDSWGR